MDVRDADSPHWSARRGFIAAAGFGGVALYGLWAAYGAAPGPLTLLGLGHDGHGEEHGDADGHSSGSGAGHGGHGGHGSPATAPDPHAFRAETDRFIEHFRVADGRVHPRRLAGHAHDGHEQQPADGPIEVPMVAGRWYYLPAALRLDANESYRFRMMTMDVSHGASIQFGRGARMLRLRPGRVTEVDLSFHRPGRYLVTCTVYCGAAHDAMQATIEVV